MITVRFIFMLAFAAALSACGDGRVEVASHFDSDNGVEPGRVVYFEDQEIGTVTAAEKTVNGVDVLLALQAEALEQISSKAALVVNSTKQGQPLEIINPSNLDAPALQAGQQLEGLDSMFEMGAWMVGDALDVSADTLNNIVESFSDYLQSDRFQDDATAVKLQIAEAAAAASDAAGDIEIDVDTALSNLKESEQQITAAVSKLGEQVSPMIKQLSESGKELLLQLEEMANSMDEQAKQEPAFGQELAQKLRDTFSRLSAELDTQLKAPELNRDDALDSSTESQ